MLTQPYAASAKTKYSLPAGMIIAWAGADEIPDGWLLCNGAAVSRDEYADLFGAIGTTFGDGDGATTFNLPDSRDKFLEGAGTYDIGAEIEARIPNATGRASQICTGYITERYAVNNITGVFSATSYAPTVAYSEDGGWSVYIDFDMSTQSSIYGDVDTVQPPSIVINHIIKS